MPHPRRERAPRLLLLEHLDAAGSRLADARARASVLRAAGAIVRVAVYGENDTEPRRAPAAPDEPAASNAVLHVGATHAERAAFERFLGEQTFDAVIIAAASARAGGPRVPGGTATYYWPTGGGPSRRWPLPTFDVHPRLLAPAEDPEDPAPWLQWCAVERTTAPARTLPLWDGDYLLAPAPLVGRSGQAVMTAFAEVARDWNGLDLVVLAETSPKVERLARRLDVAMRVHFVGPAPALAERAWWSYATVGVLAGGGPIAGGLVLRGLAAGCPLHVESSEDPGTALAAWLSRHGCAAAAKTGRLAESLVQLLERGPAVEQAIARGRALAAAHDVESLTERVRRILPAFGIGRRASRPRRADAA